MEFAIASAVSERPKADLVVVPIFKRELAVRAFSAASDLHSVIDSILKAGDFDGKKGATLLAYLEEKREKRLLLLGIGEEPKVDLETLRRSFASAIKRCRGKRWLKVNVIVPELKKWTSDEVARAIVEGISLSSYVFEEWKAKAHQELFYTERVTLVGTLSIEVVDRVVRIMTGVNLARDLVNKNALDITPQALAQEARQLAHHYSSVKADILSKKQIEKAGMGLFLAVANASQMDPALIVLEYRNDPQSDDLTMVVGKGVTFDTGGLNIKPTKFIEDMRADMGGAASALGIIQAAAAIQLEANIVVIIPATENAIGSRSYKPGDVYRSYLGKSVEITNTDAEGRLILADAIAYGQKRFAPSRIIDLATLTGAIIVSLGSVRMGLFSNNDALAKCCEHAGEATGERVWRLPLDEDYRSLLDSDIADLCNASKKRDAGSVTAALFLKEFVQGDTPWIHLDIAGTAFLDAPEHYHLTLATGIGVRLVICLIEKISLL